jgi:hypothetical protein
MLHKVTPGRTALGQWVILLEEKISRDILVSAGSLRMISEIWLISFFSLIVFLFTILWRKTQVRLWSLLWLTIILLKKFSTTILLLALYPSTRSRAPPFSDVLPYVPLLGATAHPSSHVEKPLTMVLRCQPDHQHSSRWAHCRNHTCPHTPGLEGSSSPPALDA